MAPFPAFPVMMQSENSGAELWPQKMAPPKLLVLHPVMVHPVTVGEEPPNTPMAPPLPPSARQDSILQLRMVGLEAFRQRMPAAEFPT